ncbi:S8 family serine peptidase [Nitriliruptor alkaliphilus]|uniref:S8 family serine peptidase n=1 Tax=Nitriliruptor alkaliphilus TaxID=427918 RepID=UPI000697EFED|nr:S8 family serine peptidase [Nitriliruptor alkaliphilus]
MQRTFVSFGTAALLAASLLVPVAASAAPDETPADRPPTPPPVAAEDFDYGEGVAPREYFVRLAAPPAVANTEDGPGRSASARDRGDGSVEFDGRSAEARRYRGQLVEAQVEVATTGAERTVGRQLDIAGSFTVVNNGFATEMTPAEARRLATLTEVTWIQQALEYELHTDRGPGFVGARGPVWDRPADGLATGDALGEGVVVGVIDTGINPSSPSFAAVSADGYEHQNPRGAGNYVGSCDPTNVPGGPGEGVALVDYGIFTPDGAHYDEDLAALCNDKLIGMWGYNSVTGSPIDYNGHGSHTAGTAAGGFADGVSANTGEAQIGGNLFDVAGVAPRANIIAYNACCSMIGLVTAIDQAVVDGVDVINFSIGATSPTPNLLQDPLTVGFLLARHAGVHVANSAGNSGPNPATVGSPSDAPWLTSVASSTHDRLALNELTDLTDATGSTLPSIEGKGVSDALEEPTPLVYAGDFGNRLCLPDVWEPGTFDGQIVVCDRGETGRVDKSVRAAAAGAAGFVLANDAANSGSVAGSLNGDSFPIPGVHVTYDDGVALKAWMAAADEPTATIAGTRFDVDDRWGDIVSVFSSRGPNVNDASVMVPQVTAPGMDILAPYGADDSTEYQFISGTSMSSPHVAGAFALLVDGFEGALSPAEAQSALQLTARRDVTKTDGTTAADPYDVGSGHIDVAAALATGIVMEQPTQGYIDAVVAGDSSALNLASMAEGQCISVCSWERTFTGAPGTGTVAWTASTQADGFGLTVEPVAFTLSEGESVTVTVTADVAGLPAFEDRFGSLELTPADGSVAPAHLPAIVRAAPFGGPERIELTSDGYEDADTVTYTAADAPDLQVGVDGLVPGDILDLEVPQDPTPNAPYDDLSHVVVEWVEVPEDALRLVASVTETTSPDIDLYVGLDADGDGVPAASEQLCAAASAGSDETCELTDPSPGSYWILVQNWEASAAGVDPVELVTAVVPAGDAGNLSADAPASVGARETFDIDLAWDLAPPATRWFGQLTLGSSAQTPQELRVPIDLVVELPAPVADAGGPYRTSPGQWVTLDGTGSSGDIASYVWDLSELGQPDATGPSPRVRVRQPGTYTVTLTVTDTLGRSATDTGQIVVGPPGRGSGG